VADFYCHGAGLAVEVDGETHDDPERDALRDRVFAANGIRVLRFTNREVVNEIEGVLEAIVKCVESGSTSPPTPLLRREGS